MDLLRIAVAAAFALLALVCVRIWSRRRSRPSAWMAATFTALAAGLLIGRLDDLATGGVAVVLERVARLSIVAFPYLLFRFAASIEPPARALRYAAHTLAVPLLMASALAPGPDEGTAAWYFVFVFATLVFWTALSSLVVWRFWRAGRAQPVVARRRMHTLSAAAAGLNLALVAAGVSTTAQAPGWVTPAAQVVALLSAGLFLLAFAAPPALRSAWRRADQRAVWGAESRLVAATTTDEVVSGMLPHVSRLLGGGPAVFVDRFGNEWTHGVPPPELRRRLSAGDPPRSPTEDEALLTLDLRTGRLGVAASPFTPLFGSDELELARGMGTLMDLALSRVELHERERVARARAEELTKELEALVYGITHDLRNPIVAVLGYLECLAEDYGPQLDEEGRHFLSRLRTNAEYMDRLIADLLALSRVGRVPEVAEAVDLTSLTEGVAVELRAAYPAATIEVGALPKVLISPSRGRQLMTNLVSNALVHSGRADVTVRVRSSHERGCAGKACVAVTDDGRGIPEAYRAKVFDLFERLEHGDKDSHGTGIGLAMCQRIVNQAGGRIWVADCDVGADVRVQLPRADRAVAGMEGER